MDLYKRYPTNSNIAFKLGICNQSSRTERIKAISYFKKATESNSDDYKGSSYKEKNAPLIAYKFLEDAYHLNYEFDKAITAYEKFIFVTDYGKTMPAAPNKKSNGTDNPDGRQLNRRVELKVTQIL